MEIYLRFVGASLAFNSSYKMASSLMPFPFFVTNIYSLFSIVVACSASSEMTSLTYTFCFLLSLGFTICNSTNHPTLFHNFQQHYFLNPQDPSFIGMKGQKNGTG